MSQYFNYFPKVVYSQDKYTKIVTNIMARIRPVSEYANNSLVFYNYDIQDGDTPESIAYKYYQDIEKHWIILLTNNIIDPFYDWPLDYKKFNVYLTDKYMDATAANLSISVADVTPQQVLAYTQLTTDHYEKVVISTDLVTGTITTNNYYIDENTFNTFIPKIYQTSICTINEYVQRVLIYDNEQSINESKRSIKILNNQYTSEIFNELKSLLGN